MGIQPPSQLRLQLDVFEFSYPARGPGGLELPPGQLVRTPGAWGAKPPRRKEQPSPLGRGQGGGDPLFDGPLDLLLSLIEQRRLPITQVSLAQVADQYLAYVHGMPELDTNLLADFLQIGSKLLLLKSRALLLTEEPDPLVEATAEELEERLAVYRVFRGAAEYLQELEQRGSRMHATRREPSILDVPGLLAPISPHDLANALRRLSAAVRQPVLDLPLPVRASVDQRRAAILDVLRLRGRASFREIAGTTVDEVVATFLAILELFRRGQVQVQQGRQFADLVLLPAPG